MTLSENQPQISHNTSNKHFHNRLLIFKFWQKQYTRKKKSKPDYVANLQLLREYHVAQFLSFYVTQHINHGYSKYINNIDLHTYQIYHNLGN